MKSNRAPWTVLALASAQVLLSLLYAYATPAFQASDETQHIDMALEAGRLTQWPEVREHPVAPAVREAKSLTLFRQRNSPRPAESAPPRNERESFEELGEAYSPGAPNHINQHPPLYYAVVNAWTTTITSVSPVDLTAFDRSVLLMRSLGALMSGGVVILCWMGAQTLRLDPRSSLLAATFPMLIPMFSFVHGSVNNDALVVLLVAATTVQLLQVLMGDLTNKRAIAIGILGGAAMLTKFFGVFTLPMVIVTPLLARSEHTKIKRIRFGLVSASIAFVAGGWWWLRNLIVEGTLQPRGLVSSGDSLESVPPIGIFLRGMDVRLWQGFVGRFGFINTPVPRWLILLLSAFLLLAFVGGVREIYLRGRSSTTSLGIGISTFPVYLILPIMLYRSFVRFLTRGAVAGMQGRYLFSGVIGLALLSALGLGRLPSRATGWVVSSLVVVANTVGLHSIVRHFWGTEGGGLGDSLLALGHWAPFAPAWTVSLFAVGMLVLMTAMVLLVRSMHVPHSQRSPEPT